MIKSGEKSIRIAYGDTLKRIGHKNEKIVVLDADLAHATMTCEFQKEFPERFFNVGVAEQNLMGMASGLAIAGYVPFASTFALFGAGRAYEQVRNSVVYNKLNVKIAVTHSGLTVGEDGGSHQAIEDISLMRSIPGMTVIVPSDANEAEKAIEAAAEMEGPVYLRLARPVAPIYTNSEECFEIGKGKIVHSGKDICIFATGLMVYETLEAVEILKKSGIDATVVNIHTIKPLDKDLIKSMREKHNLFVSVEEHSVVGGLGSAILEEMSEDSVPLKKIGVNDVFGESGTPDELMEYHGLKAGKIAETIAEFYKSKCLNYKGGEGNELLRNKRA